jgi:hypothetical protein
MRWRGSLVVGASAALAAATSLDAELEATPLTKVVTLLKEMKSQIETEMKQDQEVYDKLACWCHTNDEEKTDAISEANTRIETLTAKVQELSGNYEALAGEVKKIKEDLATNEAALEATTQQREKEAAAFHQTEKDSIQALGQLKGALTVLNKMQGAALNQETLGNLRAVLRTAAYRFPSVAEDARSTASLLQARPYANQSGEIFGFLGQMKEQMEQDLSEAQQADLKAAEDFEALRTSKKEEIAAARELLESKQQAHSDTGLKLAQTKDDLDETEAQLDADTKFLADLKKRCKANDEEMAARTKARQDEIIAINETVDILTADEARDVAGDALGRTASFVQLSERIHAERTQLLRDRAARVLRRAASKSEQNSPDLSMLASSVQLDAFTKVKKAIDDMVSALKTQQADEVKHKDFCNAEFQSNEMETATANRKVEELKAKQDDLEQQIKEFTDSIQQLQAEIVESRVELQRATNERIAQNKVFNKTVADQVATQAVLDKAIKRMDAYYNAKSDTGAFVQTHAHQGPPGLSKDGYSKSGGAGGIIGMLKEIKSDSKIAENEAVKDEADAVSAYEEFVSNTNASIDEKAKAVVDTTANRAQADKDLVQTKEDISATLSELEKLAEYNASLHKQCDFVVKNFEVRQQARAEEMEALQQAKQILSGAQ